MILVDGFITSAAVLVASRLQPHVLQRCVFAHRSANAATSSCWRNAGRAAARPGFAPGRRLRRGAGLAAAASACAILREMASF